MIGELLATIEAAVRSMGVGAVIVAAALVGAIGWRGRGGWYGLGSTGLSRVLGVVPLAPFAWWAGEWPALVAAMLLIPPLTFGWAEWQDMGTVADNDDFVGMTGRGFLQVSLSVTALHLLVSNEASIVFMWVGATMGAIYWTAKEFRRHVRPIVVFGRNLVDGFTSVAELVVGATLYAGFVAAIVFAAPISRVTSAAVAPLLRFLETLP